MEGKGAIARRIIPSRCSGTPALSGAAIGSGMLSEPLKMLSTELSTNQSATTVRAIAKAAQIDGTTVGLGWLMYGGEYANHAVDEEDLRRFYRGEAKLMRR
jgi:hypothetical protein